MFHHSVTSVNQKYEIQYILSVRQKQGHIFSGFLSVVFHFLDGYKRRFILSSSQRKHLFLVPEKNHCGIVFIVAL